MKKSCAMICLVILAVISLQVVLADTDITVKGIPGYSLEVRLNVLNANTGESIRIYENYTDKTTGNIVFNYAGTGVVGISVIARQNGKIIVNKHYGNFSASGPNTIELFPPQTPVVYTPPVTTASVVNNTTSTNNTTENLTGNAIANTPTNSSIGNFFKSFSIKQTWGEIDLWVYSILGLIFIVGFIYFTAPMVIRKIKEGHIGSSSSKKDDLVLEINPKMEKELAEAQKKIAEAQETIDLIKNRKNKLTEAEKKFEEAKRELEKVKRGY